MNKETYEALKRVVNTVDVLRRGNELIKAVIKQEDIIQLWSWIDEVAKEYEGECDVCGDYPAEVETEDNQLLCEACGTKWTIRQRDGVKEN